MAEPIIVMLRVMRVDGITFKFTSAIDAAPAEYGFAGRTNVAGIAELLPLSAVRDAFRFTVGDRPLRVSAVAFDGPTGRAELAQVRAFDWSPHRLVETAAVGSLDAWKGFVESRGADVDVLLVLSYAGLPVHDGDHVVADGPAIAAWTERLARHPGVRARRAQAAAAAQARGAAANNGHTPGQGWQGEEPIRDHAMLGARNIQLHRLAAGGDDDALCSDALAADIQRMGIDKSRARIKHLATSAHQQLAVNP
jgi:hypothetical protein